MQIAKLRVLAELDSQAPSDSVRPKLGAKTPSSVVIPVKRVGADDKKTSTTTITSSKEPASSQSAAAAVDAKPARKLFSVSRLRS